MSNELSKYPAPVRRAVTTPAEARSFMSQYRGCPPALQEMATQLWTIRNQQKQGLITAAEARSLEAALVANGKDDADRRFRLEAYGRLFESDANLAKIMCQRAAQDDIEDEPDEQDVQDALDELYADNGDYQYIGRDDDSGNAYCLLGEDLYSLPFARTNDGNVIFGGRKRLTLAEVSSLRSRFLGLEQAQLLAHDRLKWRTSR